MAKILLDGADLKLGLFSANCSSGMAVTKIEDRWQATWDDNLRLGRLADEVGIDFMLPIARWIGYGGDTNFHEGVLDPVALAAGLLAETERIFVFATIHTAFTHPLVAAKQMATVDQIGRGRAGLNIVAGWNKPEYDAMGVDLPQDHDDRYAYAQEWWEIVRRLWTEPGRYDIDGRFWQLQGVESMPKPFDGLLPILNAGSSDAGPRLRGPQLERGLHGGRRPGRRCGRRRDGARRTHVTPTAARSACSRPRTASVAGRRRRRRSSTAGTRTRTPTGTPSTT